MNKTVDIFDEQTSITTGLSDVFLVNPDAHISVVGTVATTGEASLQCSTDPAHIIEGGTPTWVDSANSAYVSDFLEGSTAPITAVRLSVASGVWAIKVLQTSSN